MSLFRRRPSQSSDDATPAGPDADRRGAPRVRLAPEMVMVELGPGSGGLLLDLSSEGLAVQVVGDVRVGATTTVEFEIPGSPGKVQGTGKILRVEGNGKAAIRLVRLPEPAKLRLGAWIEALAAREETSTPPASLDPERAGPGTHDRLPEPLIAMLSELVERQLDGDAALHLMAVRLQTSCSADAATIYLAEGQHLVCRAGSGATPGIGSRGSALPAACAHSRALIRMDNFRLEARLPVERRRAGGSALLAPIVNRDSALGVLEVVSGKPHAFAGDAEQLLTTLAELLAAGGLQPDQAPARKR